MFPFHAVFFFSSQLFATAIEIQHYSPYLTPFPLPTYRSVPFSPLPKPLRRQKARLSLCRAMCRYRRCLLWEASNVFMITCHCDTEQTSLMGPWRAFGDEPSMYLCHDSCRRSCTLVCLSSDRFCRSQPPRSSIKRGYKRGGCVVQWFGQPWCARRHFVADESKLEARTCKGTIVWS